MPIICGFSLAQDRKNSLENDRSFEIKTDDDEEEDEEVDNPDPVVVAPENEETEEGEGETAGACEITSLSWIWLLKSSLVVVLKFVLNFFLLGLHLLMQEPIGLMIFGEGQNVKNEKYGEDSVFESQVMCGLMF